MLRVVLVQRGELLRYNAARELSGAKTACK
jgi:hypothetical protein